LRRVSHAAQRNDATAVLPLLRVTTTAPAAGDLTSLSPTTLKLCGLW
jgi:hypothetical protein